MTCDYIELANPGVQALRPYQPGKPIEELERELGISNIIKLASNENPLGPSQSVLSAIQKSSEELCRYPDGNGFALKNELASFHGIDRDQITLGNGSNDILELLARAYTGPGVDIMFSEYAFAVYPIVTQACGATALVVPAKDWAHDLSAMAKSVTEKTRLIFLANPNNPSGTFFDKASFEKFMAAIAEDVIVVLDEAYFEYAEQLKKETYTSGLNYLSRYPNLVVTRTFSKAYGLAALRIGYSISNSQIADALNRVRQPFNVNSLAMSAALAALQDQNYLEKSVELNTSGLKQLGDGFKKLGLKYIPSVGNFVSVSFKQDANKIYNDLLHEGVIVRPIANYSMPDFLRVTVGLPEENSRFLTALKKIL